jgi:WD40 repeat protein
VWNANLKENLHQLVLRGPQSHATRVLFSSDVKLLATAYSGHPIVLWHIHTMRPPTVLSKLDGDLGRCFVRMAFSPDSRQFACWILPESRERSTRHLLGMDDLDYSHNPEAGRSFMTHIFKLPSGQRILEGKSYGPFNRMELLVYKNELIHKWRDHTTGVVDLRTRIYSSRIPIDKEVKQGPGLGDSRKDSRQSLVVQVRYFITPLQSCHYHGTMSTVLWRFVKIWLLSGMSLVVLHS